MGLRSFLGRPRRQQLLCAKAWGTIWLVRLSLSLLRYARTRRVAERLAKDRTRPSRTDVASADEVAWAVDVASRYVIGGRHCLTRAMAADILLRRRGISAEVRIGVSRQNSRLIAHAWVVHDDNVLLGGTEHDKYQELTMSESSPSTGPERPQDDVP